ncbi:MAG: M66 family metalloprotease [Pseudomonadales bacterium]|nr:M66 family metalloprotease [Pseudomonadales bacterium]
MRKTTIGLTLALILSGCGGSDDGSDTTTPETTPGGSDQTENPPTTGDGDSGDGGQPPAVPDGSGDDGANGSDDNGDGDTGNGGTDAGDSSSDGDDGEDGTTPDGGDSQPDEPAATAPELTSSAPAAIAGLRYHYQPTFSDQVSDGTFDASGLPAWASLDPSSGAVTGTPNHDDVTAHKAFELAVTLDGQRYGFNQTLTVHPTTAFVPNDALDFRATDYDGQPRALRNDLSTGSLAGEVMFAQSHTVLPHGNFQRDAGDETRSTYRPRLVALRDALLLFTPDTSATPVTVEVALSHNGAPVGRFTMQPPGALPRSDYQGPQRIEYSTRAWSLRLPWDTVRNGLSLTFTVNDDAPDASSGTLAAADIEIGDASQIVFQSIRLGMLTHYDDVDGHFTLRDPVMAATDYFQTLPVSKLVMGSYADMQLDRVILGSGKIYDDVSDDEGGIYSGDMRGDVAKSQVSVGINQANYGVTSSNMRQSYPHVFKQITNHHAWGNYQNGRIKHGLSGGNGIGTLVASWGNEASHEWGHAYGLGHYPGANLTDDGRWQRHHADSGWGFIAHRNRMRDNLANNSWSNETQPSGSHYQGHIPYRRDAMSGGGGSTPFSHYTHYTGYSARLIQNDLASFPVPDAAFSTGYKRWNTTTGEYQTHHFSGATPPPVPVQVGVPVATLLGGYDPDGGQALIYPVFHGNYGNVFDLPEPDLSGSDDACWLTVANAAGEQQRVAVSASRHHSNTINQLHMNLDANFRPTSATLTCRRSGTETELARTSFDGQIPELPPAAIVGQDQGFQQLRQRELAELDSTLQSLASEDFPVPSPRARMLLDSYSANQLLNDLNPAAREVYLALASRKTTVTLGQALIHKLEAENLPGDQIQQQLTDMLMDRGLINSVADIELNGSGIHNDVRYLALPETADGNLGITTESDAGDWLMSPRGSLHPVTQPWRCMAPSNGRLALANCDPDNDSQEWTLRSDATLQNARTGQCVDYASHNQTLLMYGCHGNWNQKWQGIRVSDNGVLAALPGDVIRTLYQDQGSVSH